MEDTTLVFKFFYYYLIQLFINKWKFLQQLISINFITNETKSK